MRIPGRKTAIRTGRWIRSRFAPRALILGYHRVARVDSDPFDIAIDPERFRAHLEVIRRRACATRLGDLAAALESGSVPNRAVAVTLDDGYTDSLENAKPALETRGIPATVFMIAGHVGREMWWDELARLFESNSDGDLLRKTHDRLHDLSEIARERELEKLRSSSNEPRLSTPRTLLDAAGIAALAEGGLIEVGAHGHTHRRLAELDKEEQRAEIAASRRILQDILGRKVDLFSYPHGSNLPVSRALLREAGFRCACASQPDVVRRATDRFALPRFWVSDLDDGGLEKLLDHWLGRL